jgi:hypothetical protein
MKKSLIIIIIFIIVFLFIKEEPFTNIITVPKVQPKILHLVLFSHDNGPYDMMYQLTSKFYKSFPNVTTYYYSFDPNIEGIYQIKDDILYIKGDEGYIPNILDKTMKAFDYFNKRMDYDYIVRSNISTIINFNLLSEKLLHDTLDYGGTSSALNWLAPDYGIVDEKYFGLNFVSGLCIILSKKIVNKILENRANLNYNIIDDVAIGILIRDYIPNTKLTTYNNYLDSIFFRNRTTDRYNDIENMKLIINNIMR